MRIDIEVPRDKIDWKKIFLKKTRDYWRTALTLTLLIGGLVFISFLAQRKQTIWTKASGSNSSVDLPAAISSTPGETFDAPIAVNNDETEVIAADIILNFDKNYLQLIDIIPNTTSNNLKIFLPIDEKMEFDKAQVIISANEKGQVQFSALCYLQEPCYQGLIAPLTFENPLATLKFKSLLAGSTSLNVSFLSQGLTTDSNLATRDQKDILGHVISSTINISAPVEQNPSPEPTIESIPTIVSTQETGISLKK